MSKQSIIQKRHFSETQYQLEQSRKDLTEKLRREQEDREERRKLEEVKITAENERRKMEEGSFRARKCSPPQFSLFLKFSQNASVCKKSN